MGIDPGSAKSKETIHRRFILERTLIYRAASMQYTQEGIIKITTMLLNVKQSATVRNDWAKSNKLVCPGENLNIQMFGVIWL